MEPGGRVRAVLDRLGWGLDAAGLFRESIEFVEDPAGTSQAGGLPRLDGGLAAWPYAAATWPRVFGQPLALRARIDLSALPRIPQLAALPDRGWLNAFSGFGEKDYAGALILASPDAPEVPPPRGLPKHETSPPLPLAPHVRVILDWRTEDPRSPLAAEAMPELDADKSMAPLCACTTPRLWQDMPELPGPEPEEAWGVFLLFDALMCSRGTGDGIVHWWLRDADLAAGRLDRLFADWQVD